MNTSTIQERDGGFFIDDTRITLSHLLPYLQDPTMTERQMMIATGLTATQIATARAFILDNYESVQNYHRRMEEFHRRGNSPEAIRAFEEARARLGSVEDWLAKKEVPASKPASVPLMSFRDWLKDQEAALDLAEAEK